MKALNLSTDTRQLLGLAWARGEPITTIGKRHGISPAQAWREVKKLGLVRLRKNRPGVAAVICSEYVKGESASKLAKRFLMAKQQVLKVLRAGGVDTASKRCVLKFTGQTLPPDAQIVSDYKRGITCQEIADKYGLGFGYVWARIDKAGVSRRQSIKGSLGWNEETSRREKQRHYELRRLKTPAGRIKAFARNQLTKIKRCALGFVKKGRTNEYLGCTYAEAVAHIEKQLKPGWTWANHGKDWHIDHIVQFSDGPLTNEFHIRAVCHYSNLRPLGAFENMSRPSGPWINKVV